MGGAGHRAKLPQHHKAEDHESEVAVTEVDLGQLMFFRDVTDVDSGTEVDSGHLLCGSCRA